MACCRPQESEQSLSRDAQRPETSINTLINRAEGLGFRVLGFRGLGF